MFGGSKGKRTKEADVEKFKLEVERSLNCCNCLANSKHDDSREGKEVFGGGEMCKQISKRSSSHAFTNLTLPTFPSNINIDTSITHIEAAARSPVNLTSRTFALATYFMPDNHQQSYLA